jgi:hypothetical protein
MGQPVSGNVLDNASLPPGTTAAVTGFSIAGSSQIYPPGSTATVTDPVTGDAIGTLTISSTGAYTFDPVPGYAGPVPSANVYEQTSSGLTAISTLTIDVLPGKRHSPHRACGTRCC